jgi:uncharacterized protein (DUF1501 family)
MPDADPALPSRRRLLQGLAAAACAGGAARSQVWAMPAGGRSRFVFVLLRGGYDAMTLLVPSASLYREWRPRLAVPWAGADGSTGAQPLDSDWALHPAAADALAPLLRAGQIGFVPFAGTQDLTRSHFETQDTIEGGLAVGGRAPVRSGFLNRLAAVLGGSGQGQALPPVAAATAAAGMTAGMPPGAIASTAALARRLGPIAFSEQLPLAFRGPVAVANTPLRQAPRRVGGEALQPAITRMYAGHALQRPVDEAFALRAEIARQLQGEMMAADRQAVSARGFEAEARRIGLVLRADHRLAFVDVGGWDTHVGQGCLQGPLPTRLAELGRGLVALADALGHDEWAHTVVVVGSEFGRTLRENGAQGTDHGHGSVWWVAGGGLSGASPGRPVRGEQVAITATTVHQDRDLPVLNDWRAWVGGLLQRQFALDGRALATVFPEATTVDLGWL